MDVQQSKKHLAGVLLSPHDGERVDDSLERLQVYHAFFLFSMAPTLLSRVTLTMGVCIEIAVTTIDSEEEGWELSVPRLIRSTW